MDAEQLLTTPDGSIDINNQLPDIDSMMSNIIGPFVWISLALTVLFVVLYLYSMMRRRKLEKALLDIQKVLNEMNERDRARSKPVVPPTPTKDFGTIAASELPKKTDSTATS